MAVTLFNTSNPTVCNSSSGSLERTKAIMVALFVVLGIGMLAAAGLFLYLYLQPISPINFLVGSIISSIGGIVFLIGGCLTAQEPI